VFTALHHLIDREWLRTAYELTRKDGAPGIDGVTATDYEADLDRHLDDLLHRLKTGRYVAPPVRRAYIPKADGSQRPLGIPTFEDKVAQRAIVMVLEPLYEQTFLPVSYGFRPGRSAHQALRALRDHILDASGRWILDLDIQRYFDTIEHQRLRAVLDQRVRDGVIRRLIDKWLSAGVLEDGRLARRHEGTPQGGVISPLLANIFLHAVLDEWFVRDVVTFVELDDTIPVHGADKELDENLLWDDVFALVEPKDHRVVVCLRSGVTRVSEIATLLAYANHSAVSKKLARIRERARPLLG